MKLTFFMCLLMVMASCGNQVEPEEKTSLADSLLSQVMAGHDVAMPKMMKLERLQRQTQQAIDSINKLPAARQHGGYKAKLDSVKKALDYGDFAMSQWMQEFKYDSLKNNEPARIQYLQREVEKVNKMKDAVLSSISRADSVFAK